MKLAHELAKVLEEELGKDLQLEIDQDKYLSDESFKTSRQRAVALLQPANDRVLNILTRAIIEHREAEHEEDKTVEKQVVEMSMSEADIETSTRIWWSN